MKANVIEVIRSKECWLARADFSSGEWVPMPLTAQATWADAVETLRQVPANNGYAIVFAGDFAQAVR